MLGPSHHGGGRQEWHAEGWWQEGRAGRCSSLSPPPSRAMSRLPGRSPPRKSIMHGRPPSHKLGVVEGYLVNLSTVIWGRKGVGHGGRNISTIGNIGVILPYLLSGGRQVVPPVFLSPPHWNASSEISLHLQK